MYDKLINTYGTDITVPYRIFSKPGPDFRTWGPVLTGTTPSNETTVDLPPTAWVYGDNPSVSSSDQGYYAVDTVSTINSDKFFEGRNIETPLLS